MMSNVIAFLESLGKDAALPVSGDGFVAAVDALGLDDAPRQALLDGDEMTLGALLGARPTMVCALFPADEPQPEEEPQPDGDAPDEKKESVRRTGLH